MPGQAVAATQAKKSNGNPSAARAAASPLRKKRCSLRSTAPTTTPSSIRQGLSLNLERTGTLPDVASQAAPPASLPGLQAISGAILFAGDVAAILAGSMKRGRVRFLPSSQPNLKSPKAGSGEKARCRLSEDASVHPLSFPLTTSFLSLVAEARCCRIFL